MQMRTTLAALVASFALPLSLCAQPAPPAPPADEGLTVLGRGPIHEAFAEPTPKDPQASPLILKQPPPPIKELPPAQKPASPNAEWIPGYWQWDVARNDFVWVSGVWRTAPPGRQWTPGYWHQTGAGGYQWVPGFWSPAGQVETPLPTPPASLEVGPSSPAPDTNRTYAPGVWMDTNAGYAWRPGYWAPAYNDWVWNPSYYSWTPAGAVFVSGFWDRPLDARGLLFAPVAFNNALWQNPDWCFTPTYAVNPAALLDSLFYQPWGDYYFGDYYNPYFASDYGFAPWWYNGAGYYDPLFSYYGWRHRFERGWAGGLRNHYYGRRSGIMAGPPVTVAAGRGTGFITPLNRVTGLRGLSAGQRQVHAQTARRYSTMAQTRGQLHSAAYTLNGRYAASGSRYAGYSGSINPSRSTAAFRGYAASNRTFTSGLGSHSHTSAPSGGRGFSYRAASISHAAHTSARPSGGGHSGAARSGGHGGGHSGGHGGGHSGGGHHK